MDLPSLTEFLRALVPMLPWASAGFVSGVIVGWRLRDRRDGERVTGA